MASLARAGCADTMLPEQALESAVVPALALLPANMGGDRAKVMLLAIGLQESRFEYRRQLGNGPARGFWQFEKGGGVKGVLMHDDTFAPARILCQACGVQAAPAPVWNALEKDDILAAGFARLLLWSDPKPLPAIDDAAGSWNLYLRTWRPGKPHPSTWGDCFEKARLAVVR